MNSIKICNIYTYTYINRAILKLYFNFIDCNTERKRIHAMLKINVTSFKNTHKF